MSELAQEHQTDVGAHDRDTTWMRIPRGSRLLGPTGLAAPGLLLAAWANPFPHASAPAVAGALVVAVLATAGGVILVPFAVSVRRRALATVLLLVVTGISAALVNSSRPERLADGGYAPPLLGLSGGLGLAMLGAALAILPHENVGRTVRRFWFLPGVAPGAVYAAFVAPLAALQGWDGLSAPELIAGALLRGLPLALAAMSIGLFVRPRRRDDPLVRSWLFLMFLLSVPSLCAGAVLAGISMAADSQLDAAQAALAWAVLVSGLACGAAFLAVVTLWDSSRMTGGGRKTRSGPARLLSRSARWVLASLKWRWNSRFPLALWGTQNEGPGTLLRRIAAVDRDLADRIYLMSHRRQRQVAAGIAEWMVVRLAERGVRLVGESVDGLTPSEAWLTLAEQLDGDYLKAIEDGADAEDVSRRYSLARAASAVALSLQDNPRLAAEEAAYEAYEASHDLNQLRRLCGLS